MDARDAMDGGSSTADDAGPDAAEKRCIEPHSGLEWWWPADGDAFDVISETASELTNGVSYAPGKVGQAFQLDGIDGVV